jgi:hypothetical protein
MDHSTEKRRQRRRFETALHVANSAAKTQTVASRVLEYENISHEEAEAAYEDAIRRLPKAEDEKSRFREFLEWASRQVATWPGWKRCLLGKVRP